MDKLIAEMQRIFADDNISIDEVERVLSGYKSRERDWSKYALFDERNYTRNLVDTGNGKYNMIVLCWGPGMCTNVHDHSGAHCFVKILQGELMETRFEFPEEGNSAIRPLTKIDETIAGLNDVTYISDKVGLHRMENPSHTEPAVSLHIYSPPYNICHLFDQRTSQRHPSKVIFWSEYGRKVDKDEHPFDPIGDSSAVPTCSKWG